MVTENKTTQLLDRNSKKLRDNKGAVYRPNVQKHLEEVDRKIDTRNLLGAPLNIQAMYSALLADQDDPIPDDDKIAESNLLKRTKIYDSIHKQITRAKDSNRHMLSLFPDIKRAVMMIISSMLSASKMTDTQILYRNGNKNLKLDKSVMGEILNVIENRMNTEYKFQDVLGDILYEVCATDGSSPRLVLSESVVNDVINSDMISKITMESYKQILKDNVGSVMTPKGIIQGSFNYEIPEGKEDSNEHKMLKAMFDMADADLTDNLDVVNLPRVKQTIRRNLIKSSTKGGSTITKLNNEKLRYLDIFRVKDKDSDGERPFLTLHERDEATRKSIGKALELKLPPESVFAVFPPGHKDKHLGYVVMMDENYKPITGDITKVGFRNTNDNLHTDQSPTGAIASTYRDLLGEKCNGIDTRELYDLHGKVIEQKIKDMFIKSAYGEEVQISNLEYIHYTMFFRSLKDQKTQFLYVPESSMCYFSLNNNDYGIGKSLLEDIRVIAGIRSVIFFAEIMGFTRSSINVTDVDITLDEMDGNPDKTFEMIKGLILSAAGGSIPFGMEDPQEISTWLLTAGYRFNLAAMPGMPNIDIQYRSSGSDHVPVQSDLKEILQELCILGLGVPPEMISELFSSEFAIGKLIQNAEFVKLIRDYQKLFSVEMTKYVSTIVYNDTELRDEIKQILKSNEQAVKESTRVMKETLGIGSGDIRVNPDLDEDAYIENYIDEICKSLDVSLPLLNDSGLDANIEEVRRFTEVVDELLDIMLSDRVYDEENAGQSGLRLETVKHMIKIHMVKQWAAENNYMQPMFNFLTNITDDSEESIEEIEATFGGVLNNMNKIIGSMTKIKIASDKDMAIILEKARKAADSLNDDDSGGSLDFSSVDDDNDDDDDDSGSDDDDGFGDLDDW